MKPFFLLAIAALATVPASSQKMQARHQRGPIIDFALGYTGLQPTGTMAHLGWRSGLQVGLGTRVFKKRLHLGLDFTALPQVQEGDKLDWEMNGRTVTARGRHHQARTFVGGVAKAYLTQRKGLNYLLLGGMGTYHSSSEVYVEEINDPECRALAERTYFRDRTGYRYAGAGVAWSSGWSVGVDDEYNATCFNLELTVRHQWTGAVNHMTLRRAGDTRPLPPNATAVDIEFINGQTAETHRHRVGYQQREQLNGWQVGLALVFSGFTGGKRAAKRL